ncbi:MAG TPA: response regulator [Gemmatimonadales bacterium]|jgi:PAS domain S-box-containing protein
MRVDQLRILIVEDVPMDAELVEYELERARIGFTARRVDTRENFLRALEEFHPDLILSDYTLPRFDGMSALALARQRAPTTPFLIVTGSINEETAVQCMKAGATDYLLKSNLARIGPAIEGALAREESRRETARAEGALRRSEANLRAIFNNSLQCFVLIGRDGTIQALNRTAREWALRLLGHGVEEGQRIEDFLPDWTASFHAALGGETLTREVCVRGADGVERWFETVHAPVVDEAGRVIGVCLNARDVTSRNRAEQALRESEERYRDLFDNASDLVCATAPDGTFLYVNRAWQDSIGQTGAQLDGHQLAEFVHESSREQYDEIIARVLRGETVAGVELDLVATTGVTITVEGNLSCTFKDGEPALLRAIYRDVTERKRVEEQLRRAERMQAAGRLAGGMAHEVNNMMTGVIGFSEFLLRSFSPDDPRRAEVEEIIKAGSRAADVTRQLLAFTRQQFRRPELLQVNDVIADLEKMLRRLLGEDHVLEFTLCPEAGVIRADRSQMEQVLVNLVLNARDALSRPGRVTISTATVYLGQEYAQRHAEVRLSPGTYVLLSVTDTGCGMDREVQARIFEPFFTTKPVGQGTGLGLSTVYGIIKQSDGFVWAYSELEQGTTFKIYLPQAGPGRTGERMEARTGAPRGGTETILLVEDEPMVRGLAGRGLREYGYRVLEAADGDEALGVIADSGQTIDLVISDLVMPVMGGRELGHKLAELDPSMPVLFMSGYTGDDVLRRGLLEPGAPFQSKPFTAEGLARRAREMLDAQHSGALQRVQAIASDS